MLPALIVLALVAAILLVALVQARRDLASRTRQLTASASARATVEAERDLARAQEADALEQAATAREAAAAAEARSHAADAARARAEAASAEAVASLAEAATLAARLIDDGAADPAALWALERSRTERTWRHSVAAVQGDPSPLAAALHPLWTALEIEVAAVREEVGAVVDLDVDLPGTVTPGASLATLRVAQELLATAARKGEVTTLRVAADGDDLVVEASSVDADGQPVPLSALVLPPSRLDAEPGVVRLRGALVAPLARPA
ncbi:hypothetical protein KSP35_08680 [Aquihabitans sp. G128]|uniref:hypothetical protein n=1 Tax=Aquihabitans sp. G128 TaxID=2849779 RepID=UPI001C211504|nr:hypothetical protein [Aquihabitans sp. G128]QXC62837.1 hypothetical protein KSP35_08680 [Aquihabitans sp. G128]